MVCLGVCLGARGLLQVLLGGLLQSWCCCFTGQETCNNMHEMCWSGLKQCCWVMVQLTHTLQPSNHHTSSAPLPLVDLSTTGSKHSRLWAQRSILPASKHCCHNSMHGTATMYFRLCWGCTGTSARHLLKGQCHQLATRTCCVQPELPLQQLLQLFVLQLQHSWEGSPAAGSAHTHTHTHMRRLARLLAQYLHLHAGHMRCQRGVCMVTGSCCKCRR